MPGFDGRGPRGQGARGGRGRGRRQGGGGGRGRCRGQWGAARREGVEPYAGELARKGTSDEISKAYIEELEREIAMLKEQAVMSNEQSAAKASEG